MRRIVDGALRGRAPVLLGGPGMGRSTAVRAAAERLRGHGLEVAVLELADDDADSGLSPNGVTLRTGGLELARALARSRAAPAPDGRPLQRVPLLPLLRRDLRAWAAASGSVLGEDEIERAFRACGGHPALFAAWLEAHRATRDLRALEARVAEHSAGLFARLDRALEHLELAKPWRWIALRGSASVEEVRRATGATKGALDRLAMAGPVSRTLGARAEVSASCELYLRHCARS